MIRAWARHLDLIALGGLGLWFLAGGLRYGIVEEGSPGPGMAPVVFAAVLTVLVVVEGAARRGWRRNAAAAAASDEAAGFGSPGAWLVCLGTLALLILLGGVAGTFLSLLVLAAAAVADRRPRALLLGTAFAAVTAAAIYAVFGILFNLPMIPALIRLL